MGKTDLNPKVDDYIAKSQPFARPILKHLRGLVHRGCPGVEETIKWGMPFFEYRSGILGNMSGFKAHCSFGFWGREIKAVLRKDNAVSKDGMGSLGRITKLEELPSDASLLGWIRRAAGFIDSGQYTSPISARQRAAKPAPKASPEFAAALGKDKKASACFKELSPSCQREYIEWIAEAKRPETRDKRIETAVKWIAEGKQSNWKYQKG